MYYYNVFGLNVLADEAVPGLPVAQWNGPPHVRMEFRGPGDWNFPPVPDEPAYAVGSERFRLTVWPDLDGWRVHYLAEGEQLSFAVSPAADLVRVSWSRNFPALDVPAFCLGPMIGCVLRLRNILALHAGVIAVDGGAVAVTGFKGAGKSTLVGTLARKGFPVLSDDIAPILEDDGVLRAHPGYPRLRLWPETLERLSVSCRELPKVTSFFEKRYIELDGNGEGAGWRFHDRPLPLRAICFLAHRDFHGLPELVPVASAEALHLLLQNCYADYVLDHKGRLEQFKALGRIVARTPLFLVRRPDDLDALPDTCEAVASRVRSLAALRQL